MKVGGDRAQQEEFRARLVAFLPRLRRFCHGLAGSPDRGDDLLQASVARAIERAGQWEAGTSLESWMFKMTRNLHIDQFRSARGRGVAVELDEAVQLQGADPLAELEARSELEVVRRALAVMPDELREVMTVVVLDGQAYKDAAALLDIPIGTVMSRLSRSRRFVEKYLAQGSERLVSA